MISGAVFVALGYDPAAETGRVRVTTASGVEFAASVAVERINALGHERTAFPMLSHALPPTTSVDGVLGLDFLRGHRMVIDFRGGNLTLE